MSAMQACQARERAGVPLAPGMQGSSRNRRSARAGHRFPRLRIPATKIRFALAALTLLVAGCANTADPATGGPGSTPAGSAGALPCADCAARDNASDAKLPGTRWRLTRLGDTAATRSGTPRDAHIVLDADNRLSGSDGCNRIAGSYRLDGAQLSFSQLVSTRMACAEGMEQAERFGSALGAVARYRIAGGHLELFDAAGASLARFEAGAPE